MNILDMKTLVLNQILTYAVCTIVAGLLWRQNRQRFHGVDLWLACFVLQMISIALIALRGIIPDWLSIIFGGSAVPIAATILLYIGLEKFVERRTRQYHNVLLLLVSGSIHAYFAFVQPSLAARNINFSFAAILLYVQITWLMLRRVSPEMRPMTGKIGWVFIAFSFVSVARIYFNLTEPAGNDLLKANNTFDAVMFLAYQVLFFAIVFGLFLMVNQRLFLELQMQQTALQKSEARYRQLVEFSPNALFVLLDGKVALVNSAALSLMRAAHPEQLLGKTILDIVHPDYRSIAADQIVNVLARGEQVPLLEEKFIRLDGSLIDVEVTTAPLEYQGLPALQSIVRDITERKQLESNLERLATTDSLTGALNRRQLVEVADRELERAHRYDHPTSIIMLDIDHFKNINDRYGHAIGDLAIQQIAQILHENLRVIDHLGRYGGDEFTIILPETNLAESGIIAERIRASVETQKIRGSEGQVVQLSISLGLVCVENAVNEPGKNFDTVIQLADKALYKAKAAGRNRVCTA